MIPDLRPASRQLIHDSLDTPHLWVVADDPILTARSGWSSLPHANLPIKAFAFDEIAKWVNSTEVSPMRLRIAVACAHALLAPRWLLTKL